MANGDRHARRGACAGSDAVAVSDLSADATCQFPISANIRRNARWIREQVAQAKEQGADVVHFPETALSGYAHVDFPAWDGFDWDLLPAESGRVRVVNAGHEPPLWRTGAGAYHEIEADTPPVGVLETEVSMAGLEERVQSGEGMGPRFASCQWQATT